MLRRYGCGVRSDFRRPRFRVVVLIGLFLLTSATPSPAQETIDDIATELRKWRDQIQSLRVVEEWSCSEHVRGRSEAMSRLSDEELQGYFHRHLWTWKADGRSRFESLAFENHALMGRELVTRDGHLQASAEFGRGPVAVKNMTILQIAGSNLLSDLNGDRLFSLQSWLHIVHGVIDGKWQLSDATSPDNPLVAIENSGAPETQVRQHRPAKLLVWLDRRHGYLPIRRHFIGSNEASGDQITEFQNVDGVLWFPRRGWHEYGGGARALWEVREVQLNANFPDTDFEPPAPDPGTRVLDQYRKERDAITKSTLASLSPPDPTSWSDQLGRWFAIFQKDSWALYFLLGGLCLLFVVLMAQPRRRPELNPKKD